MVHVTRIRNVRSAYSVGRIEGERRFWRRRGKCNDNIRMDLNEVVCKGVDWIHLVQERNQCLRGKEMLLFVYFKCS